jgi:hypothetical protein
VADFAAPMHVAQQRYLVAPASLARSKGLDMKIFFRCDYFEILNKKGLKYKNRSVKSGFSEILTRM